MKFSEIIPEGSFESWNEEKLNEIKSNEFSDSVGTPLFENQEVKFSEIVLAPRERIPFRRHKNNYSCTFFTDGILLSRNINGQVALIHLSKGDNIFWECSNHEMVHDLENVGEETVKIAVVEQKLAKTG